MKVDIPYVYTYTYRQSQAHINHIDTIPFVTTCLEGPDIRKQVPKLYTLLVKFVQRTSPIPQKHTHNHVSCIRYPEPQNLTSKPAQNLWA